MKKPLLESQVRSSDQLTLRIHKVDYLKIKQLSKEYGRPMAHIIHALITRYEESK